MRKRSSDPIEPLLAAITTLTGRPASPADRRSFQQYLDIFLLWNRTHRMTALSSPAAIIQQLFIDSLLLLAVLPPRPLTVVDIGSGAGVPGLPLRLVDPGITLTLVESKRKRVSFLRAACREIGLGDVAVVEGRAEELVVERPDLAEAFDVAVSRGVGPVDALLPVALPYLKPGGILLVSAPPDARTHAQVEVVNVLLPGSRITRGVHLARK